MKKFLLVLMLFCTSMFTLKLSAQMTLTVADGTTTNSYVPVYGFYMDAYLRAQIIYPSSMMAGMTGSTINQMTFYLSQSPSDTWTTVMHVKMGISSDATFSGTAFLPAPSETVYTGTLTVANGQMTVTFSNPFVYTGGNLLVEFVTQSEGNYSSAYFYGISSTGSSLQGYSYTDVASISPSSRDFIPKTTFTYAQMSLTCPSPSDLMVSDITSTEATFSWTTGGTETTWDVFLTDSIMQPDSNTVPTDIATDTFYTFYNLIPNTVYHAYVRANCGGGDYSYWRSTTFRTNCSSEIVIPYLEDFENDGTGAGAHPICWNMVSNAAPANQPYIYTVNHTSGSNSLYINSTPSEYTYMVLPAVESSYSMNQMMLTFDYARLNANYNTKLIVGVMEDDSTISTFVPVDTLMPESSTYWLSAEVYFDNYTGTGRNIAILTDGRHQLTNNTFCLDYLEVKPVPSCRRPGNVHIVSSSEGSVTIEWDGNANQYEISFVDTLGLDPDSIGNLGFSYISTSNNPYTFSNLISGKEYDFFVRGVCGNDRSEWSDRLRFIAPCGEITSLPYVQTFDIEANGARPECMTTISNSYVNVPNVSNHTLYFYTQNNNTQYAVFRPLASSITVSDLEMKFKGYTATSGQMIKVGVMTDPFDESTFELVETFMPSATSTWEDHTTFFDNYTGNGKYIAFCYANPTSVYSFYVDSVVIDNMATCFVPRNVEANNVTGSSAYLTWEPGLRELQTNYTLEYSEQGQNQWTPVTVNDNNYLLGGLTQVTAYEVRVRSNCPLSNSDYVYVNFVTGCNAGGEVTVGNGTTTEYYYPVNNYYNYTYTQQLFLASELNGAADFHSIAFDYAYATPSTAKTSVNIYLGHTPATTLTTSDLVPFDSLHLVYSGPLNCQQGWNTFNFDSIFHYNGTDNLVVAVDDNSGDYDGNSYTFHAHDAGGTRTVYYYSDSNNPDPQNPSSFSGSKSTASNRSNVIFGGNCDSTATCIAPNVIVNNITDVTADVQIAAGTTETSWTVEYKTDADTLWTSLGSVNASSIPVTLTSLTPNTLYNVRVQSNCSPTESSDWATTSFTTECAVISQLSYTENFDSYTTSGSGAYPDCWHILSNYSSSNYPYLSTISSGAGTRSLYIYSTGNYYSAAILPTIDATLIQINQTMLSMKLRKTSNNYFIKVGVLSDLTDFNTFEEVAVLSPQTTNDWEQFFVSFGNYTGTGTYIALVSYNEAGLASYMYVDEVALEDLPNCFVPTSLTVTEVTQSSISLQWNGNGAQEFEVVAVPSGSTLANEIDNGNIISAYDDSITVTNLISSTLYTIYVRSNCGFESSSWANTTARTVQVPAALPWECDFESNNPGFDFVNGSSSNKWCIGTATNNGGTHSLYISNDNGVSNTYTSNSSAVWAYRDIYFPACPDGYIFSFDWKSTGESSFDYMMVFLGDPVDIAPNSTGAPAGSITMTAGTNSSYPTYFNTNSSYLTFNTTIPGMTTGAIKRLFFYWRDDSSVQNNPPASVDNISITPIYCTAPSNLTITNVGTDGATLTWTTPATVNNCVVYYKSDEDTAWTIENTASSPYTLSGLMQSTHYTVRVASDCGDGEHVSPVISGTFTTICDCSPVENLTVSQIVGTSAMLTWSNGPNGTASSYTVEYSEANQNNWIPAATNLTTPMYLLGGLDPGTAYDVRVKVFCNDNTESIWIVEHFITGCLAGGEVAVGNGTNVESYFPCYSCYNYCLTEQLYISSEIGGAGNIRSISFNASSVTATPRNWAVYLMPTTQTSLTGFVNMGTTAVKVYEGPVNITEGWFTINFTTLFPYDGTSNLILAIDDNTGSWTCSNSFYNHVNPHGNSYYYYIDDASLNPNPSSATSSSPSSSTYRANVIFGMPCDSNATCVAPNMYVNNVTAYSADVNWVAGYLEGAWEMEYALYGDSVWTPVSNPTGFTAAITQLTPATHYQVRMRSDCGSEYSSWVSADFTTECAAFPIPFSQNFTAQTYGSDVYPQCWTRDDNYSTSSAYPYMSSTGNGTLYFYATSSTYNIAMTPELNGNLSTLGVSFMLRSSNINNGLIVGVMDAPANLNSFVAVDTVFCTQSDVMQYVEVYLDSYAGTGRYVAFKTHMVSSGNFYMDDLLIDVLPTCKMPTGLAMQSSTQNSVTLEWTERGSATSWNVEYGPTGFTQGTGTTVQANSNPFTVTGLTASTVYDFYVQSDCSGGDTSVWTPKVTAATQCDLITQIPFAENFDMYTGTSSTSASTNNLPICWAYLNNGTSTSYSGYPIVYNSSSSAASGSNSIRFYTYTSVGSYDDQMAILPQIDVVQNPMNTLQLSFDARNNSSYTFQLVVGIISDPTDKTTFVPIDTIVTTSNTYANYEIPFSQYTGTGAYIAMMAPRPSSSYNAGYVDNIRVEYIPTCPKPRNLTVTNVTSNSVTLSWTEIGTTQNWNVEYGPTGFTPGAGTTVPVQGTPSTIINNLSASMYDFYVQSDCGSGDTSYWVGPVTAAPGSINIPATGSQTVNMCGGIIFDDGGATGNYSTSCNSTVVINPDAPGMMVQVSGTYDVESGYDYLTIYDGSSASGTPLFVSSVDYDDPDSGTIPTVTSTTGPLTITFTSDGSVVYGGFELHVSCVGGGGSDSCVVPTGLVVGNLAQTTATANWAAGGTETAWDIQYREHNAPTWGNTIPVQAPTYNFTGLTAATQYDVRVRANCGGNNTSDWSTAVTFQTLAQGQDPCNDPTGLTATNVTTNSVVLDWTENGTATTWTVNYKEADAANMSTATANAHPYTLTGLQPGTSYSVYVIANCANGQSGASNTVTFTTQTVGIDSYEQAISLYPNPNNGQFTINNEQFTINNVDVYDVYGKLLKTVEVNSNTAVIDAQELSAGMYFVRISTEKGVVTKSFVKK
jgi:hypothetical protein